MNFYLKILDEMHFDNISLIEQEIEQEIYQNSKQ